MSVVEVAAMAGADLCLLARDAVGYFKANVTYCHVLCAPFAGDFYVSHWLINAKRTRQSCERYEPRPSYKQNNLI